MHTRSFRRQRRTTTRTYPSESPPPHLLRRAVTHRTSVAPIVARNPGPEIRGPKRGPKLCCDRGPKWWDRIFLSFDRALKQNIAFRKFGDAFGARFRSTFRSPDLGPMIWGSISVHGWFGGSATLTAQHERYTPGGAAGRVGMGADGWKDMGTGVDIVSFARFCQTPIVLSVMSHRSMRALERVRCALL